MRWNKLTYCTILSRQPGHPVAVFLGDPEERRATARRQDYCAGGMSEDILNLDTMVVGKICPSIAHKFKSLISLQMSCLYCIMLYCTGTLAKAFILMTVRRSDPHYCFRH